MREGSGQEIEKVDWKEDPFGAFIERVEVGDEGDADRARLYAVKDMFDVAGRAPSCGLGKPPFPSPAATAPLLRRLDEAGYKRAGFTAMSALAFDPSGCNPNQTSPTNPWGADYVTGGSSSGSAVAVASGIVPLALGSDTAGSVRIPAACCGIAGWKPAWGSVPLDGTMPLSPSLDTIGLLAENTDQIVSAAPIIANSFLPQIQAGRSNGFVVIDDALEAAHPDVRRALNEVIEVLADALGPVCQVKGLEAIEAAGSATLVILGAEASASLGYLTASGSLDSALLRRLEKGRAVPQADVEEALAQRKAEAQRFLSEVMIGAPFALLPTMPLCTPRRDEVDPESPGFQPRILYAMSTYTRFVNYFGWPAVTVPAGKDARGMPVGAQFVGPPGSDRLLLHAASIVERRGLVNRKDIR